MEKIILYTRGDDAGISLGTNLETLENGEYLLITHPAFKTEEMKFYSTYWEEADSIIEKRSFDAKILIDEKVKEIIKKRKIKLEKFKKGA